MTGKKRPTCWRSALLAGASALILVTAAWSQTENVLYSFTGGSDGASPSANLIARQSNVYGTTLSGGASGQFGTVFQLTPGSPNWTETVLYRFKGGTDGESPFPGVISDSSSNLYGTTSGGGTFGKGTVFQLKPGSSHWTEKIIHSFRGTDGKSPLGGLVFDTKGNLYGTTNEGGGGGVVFKLTPDKNGDWTETVLHRFAPEVHPGDGCFPDDAPILDAAGNLYGTTNGCGAYGYGTVFELIPGSPNWTEKVLYNFSDGADGALPRAGLTLYKGSLYGTTIYGGNGGALCPGSPYNGCGVVFQMTQKNGKWTETVLYSFTGGSDGSEPFAGVVFDKSGNLVGTTINGGAYQSGAVFQLTPGSPNWTESVLYSFTGAADGWSPEASVIFDASGNIYSTTQGGGANGQGTVFEIVP
jgi:uncharacterized repeat protein (TIGR03803 family)